MDLRGDGSSRMFGSCGSSAGWVLAVCPPPLVTADHFNQLSAGGLRLLLQLATVRQSHRPEKEFKSQTYMAVVELDCWAALTSNSTLRNLLEQLKNPHTCKHMKRYRMRESEELPMYTYIKCIKCILDYYFPWLELFSLPKRVGRQPLFIAAWAQSAERQAALTQRGRQRRRGVGG